MGLGRMIDGLERCSAITVVTLIRLCINSPETIEIHPACIPQFPAML